MADEPISALTLYAAYHSADEVEILDTTDTTFASTGTNKRIQFSTLLSMAGVGTVAGGGTGLASLGSASQLLGVNTGATALEYKTLTAGSNITITPGAGSITIAASGGGGGSGTVTSVGLSLPPFITVTGSPVSTSGTLTGTLATQTANTHFAGPTSGSAAAPTFRALVAADLPPGTGTVTSVAMTAPSWLAVGGSPVTTSGTLAVTAATGQTANQVLATPNGSSGALAVRALVAADIPSLPASQITSGQIGVAQGGTASSTLTAHAVLLGEGTSALGLATTGTAGQTLVDQGSGNDPAFKAVSGDGTLAATGALTITKTSGAAFAPSATTDTTNAGNISSGTLALARGGTNANLSATGGAGNHLKQLSSGAAITVGPILLAELPSITYGAIQNESASTFLGNPTGSPAAPSEITPYANLGFVTVGSSNQLRAGAPIWVATGAGSALTNSSSATSLLTGALAPSSVGSLTIPANTLQVGSRMRFVFIGTFSGTTASSPTLKVNILLGGTSIGSWTTSAVNGAYSGCGWIIIDAGIGYLVQATGSSGKIIGSYEYNYSGWTAGLANSGVVFPAAPSQVTINTTIPLAIDLQFTWSIASVSDSIQLLGGAIYLD
jgi:hypothetical protein